MIFIYFVLYFPHFEQSVWHEVRRQKCGGWTVSIQHFSTISLVPQSALQKSLVHPFTHIFTHQWRLLLCKALPTTPQGLVSCLKPQRQRERDFNRHPFGESLVVSNLSPGHLEFRPSPSFYCDPLLSITFRTSKNFANDANYSIK